MIDQIAKKMADIALSGTQRLGPDEVHLRCQRLMESFLESVKSKNPAGFRSSLEDTLRRVESLEDDIYVWNETLAVLESNIGSVRDVMQWPDSNPQPETMLAEARATIAQHMRRQHRHTTTHQIWTADQVGQLNARLLTALDESQVYAILTSYLPQVGIQHVSVAFFEREDGNPLARCRLRQVAEQGAEVGFLSHEFPPQGLYEEPYRLILLPITGSEETPGFVTFDAVDLEKCAHIVWQLVTFLKVVHLYREAKRGGQLAETLSPIEEGPTRRSTLRSEAQRVVRKAIAYLHEHYMEAISLEDAARHVNISKEYLARCFRQETGVTLVTYLNRYRIKQAKSLLENGEDSLTKVALETGFSSSAYFSRVFRQEVGMSPSDYKRPANP